MNRSSFGMLLLWLLIQQVTSASQLTKRTPADDPSHTPPFPNANPPPWVSSSFGPTWDNDANVWNYGMHQGYIPAQQPAPFQPTPWHSSSHDHSSSSSQYHGNIKQQQAAGYTHHQNPPAGQYVGWQDFSQPRQAAPSPFAPHPQAFNNPSYGLAQPNIPFYQQQQAAAAHHHESPPVEPISSQDFQNFRFAGRVFSHHQSQQSQRSSNDPTGHSTLQASRHSGSGRGNVGGARSPIDVSDDSSSQGRRTSSSSVYDSELEKCKWTLMDHLP